MQGRLRVFSVLLAAVFLFPSLGLAAKVKLKADNNGAALERYLTADGSKKKSWEHLCFSPCEFELQLPVSLRVAGDKLIPSDPFTLSGQSAAFDLHALTVTRDERMFYAILGVGGGAVAANGLGLLLGSVLLNAMADDATEEIKVEKTAQVMLISGAISLGIGVIAGLFGLNGLLDTTTVTIE